MANKRRIRLKFDPETGLRDDGVWVLDAGHSVPRYYTDADGNLQVRSATERALIAAEQGDLDRELYEEIDE